MKGRPQTKQESQGAQLFLRITHPKMDPREITQALAIEPAQTITAGLAESGGVRRMHSESYWIAELPGTSLRDLAKRYREGIENFSVSPLAKEDFTEIAGATEWDARILLQLKGIGLETHREFLQQIIRDGGAVTLLVDRGDDRTAFAIKRSLAKLAQLGIGLEVD